MLQVFRRHGFSILLGSVFFLILYLVPVAGEYALLRLRVSAFLCCVVLSDVPGAVVLYAMGFRRAAVAAYAAATILEAVLYLNGVAPGRLIWVTNIVPALGAGATAFVFNDLELN
jgi:hypothetical protein